MQIFQVHLFEGEQRDFLDPQAVVVNQRKERAVSWGSEDREQSLDLLLGEVSDKPGEVCKAARVLGAVKEGGEDRKR